MNSAEKFLVCLCSEPNFLAINLLENLLANNCLVNIFTSDVDSWNFRTSHIAAKDKFNISDIKFYKKGFSSYRYFICLSGFLKMETAAKFVKQFLELIYTDDLKAFIILPKDIFYEVDNLFENISENIGVVYVGDLLGPRIDLGSDLKISDYLNSIVEKRQLCFPVGEVIYPLFVSDVAKQIVKWLFAFGPYGNKTFLLGPEITSAHFWSENSRLVGDIKMSTDPDKKFVVLPRNKNYFRVKGNVGYMLLETYKWISSGYAKAQYSKNKNIPTKPVPSKNIRRQKFSKPFFLLLISIFLMPLFFVILSSSLTYFSYRQLKKGGDDVAINLLRVSKTISKLGYYESTALKHIPLVGKIYNETEYSSLVLINVSEIGISGIPLIRTVNNLVNNVLGESTYSVEQVLSGSDKEIQSIYDNVSSLEQISIQDSNNSYVAKYLISKIDFYKYKQLASQIIIIAEKLPEILGLESAKTYLVLFQNNMELRPTGGFIGSYGLLTFDRGRLSDFTISDVYSADGQLNGHVEPPTPINKYLGEANWWLRDSNWDPDFPTSAKRAEWFLDKEVDQQVDGVFAIDLYPIKDFLKINGAIYLSDYNTDITADNLYEKVQSEVQDNFFPGTHKKASFLTALSRSILSEMGDLSQSQKNLLLKSIYENLDSRHLQLFLHNADTQQAISNLNWDGSVFVPKCEAGCYSDLMGIVEANVGVNKANYFINRSVSVNVEIEDEVIERTLTLTLANTANANLGLSGRYKSYIRLLVPEPTTDVKVTSSFGQNFDYLTPDITSAKGRKEIGVIVEILAGETRQISFIWSGKADTSFDKYNLYYRRQAGVDEYPIELNILPGSKIQTSNPVFSLTKTGSYLYNTSLARDLYVRLKY